MDKADDDIDETAELDRRVVEVLSKFEAEMLEGSNLLQKARNDQRQQRTAVIAQAGAAVNLIHALDISRLAGPLLLLVGALEGLNEGGNPRLFEPSRRRPGRPNATNHQWTQRALAAAALELRCVELGRGRQKEAATWVRNQTQHWDIWSTYSSDEPTQKQPLRTLNDWRRALNAPPRDDARQRMFQGRRVFTLYTNPAQGFTAEELLTKEAAVWGIPGAQAPKDE